MMAQFGIFPSPWGRGTGGVSGRSWPSGSEIKEQAAAESDPAESQRLKTMADGLKIVLNSTFGQFGNPVACCTTRRPSWL